MTLCLEHEQYHEFDVDGETIALRIDLACWDGDNRLLILDWKTGSWENELSGRAQLATYSLWAHSCLGLPVDRIIPVVVGLESGNVSRFRATEQDLQYVLDIVHADRALVDKYSVEAGFPPSSDPARCSACGFLENCAEGRDSVGL